MEPRADGGLTPVSPSSTMHAMKLMMNAKWAALAIFLVGIVLTAVLHVWHLRANTSVAEERLSVLGESVSREIGERMQSYEFGLRGAAGAVNAAGPDRMTAGAFRRYALSGDLAREFPGAHGFGVVRRVPAAEEVQFLARARGDVEIERLADGFRAAVTSQFAVGVVYSQDHAFRIHNADALVVVLHQ